MNGKVVVVSVYGATTFPILKNYNNLWYETTLKR